jgi:hypothetical protein
MSIKNELMPLPATENSPPDVYTEASGYTDINGVTIQNNTVMFFSSVKHKYFTIGAGIPEFTLDDTHYIIEFQSSDTKKIILPNIADEPTIFYIIRKHFIGDITIVPYDDDNIEGDKEIKISASDQIIKLTNDSSHTWLLI